MIKGKIMQLVNTTRDSLLRPLQTVSGIVERRRNVPVLSNILIKKSGDKVSFLSTDTKIQITVSSALSGDSNEAATTVSAAKILDVLKTLPETNDVSLSVSGNKLSLASGKSRFSLQTLPAEDFPLVPQPETYDTKITLTQSELKTLFHRVAFSMANQDIRYYLMGVMFQVEGSSVQTAATDGHRLAFFQIDTKEQYDKQKVVIPKKTVTELMRLLSDSKDLVTIEFTATQIRFSFGDVQLVSNLVDGKFPDHVRVIPKNNHNHLTLPRETLLHALQRVAIMTTDKFKGVRCRLAPNSIQFMSNTPEQEEATDELEIEYSGAEVEIGFNVTYLLDMLRTIPNEKITLSFGDANSSILLTVPDNQYFTYVVMPLRI